MNLLAQLRLLAWIEGFTYIGLGITMPLKYLYGMKEPNYYVGMLHGVFFILYIVYVLLVGYQQKFSLIKIFICCIASLFPFGTFWIDAKYLKKTDQ